MPCSLATLIGQVSQATRRMPMAEWNWSEGVALYGLVSLWKETETSFGEQMWAAAGIAYAAKRALRFGNADGAHALRSTGRKATGKAC